MNYHYNLPILISRHWTSCSCFTVLILIQEATQLGSSSSSWLSAGRSIINCLGNPLLYNFHCACWMHSFQWPAQWHYMASLPPCRKPPNQAPGCSRRYTCRDGEGTREWEMHIRPLKLLNPGLYKCCLWTQAITASFYYIIITGFNHFLA